MIKKVEAARVQIYIKYIINTLLVLGNMVLVYNKSVWYDEVYSLNLVERNIVEIIAGTAQDVHPPLYYLILKCGLTIGSHLFGINAIYVAKFVSLIPIFLTVIINHIWVRKWAGDSIWLHSFCVLTMPRIMSHAGIEIRMYSWAALFVYIAFLCAIRIIKENAGTKLWWILTLASLAAAYCHYFACISAFFIYVGLFVFVLFSEEKKGKIKCFLLSGVGVFIGYVPWLAVLVGQLQTVGNEYWIDRVGLSACIQIIEFPFGDNATPQDMACFVLLVMAVFLALISLRRIVKNSNVKIAFYALSILGLTVITGVVVSRIFRPVFVPRYMIPTLFCFWFGVVWLTKEAGTIRKYIIVLMLVIGGFYSFLRLYKNEDFIGQQVNHMLETIEITSENKESNVYITDSRHMFYILQLYCGGEHQVCLIREKDDWQNEEIKNAQYAVVSKDSFLEKDIQSSWDNLGEYRVEIYDTVVYEQNTR